MNNDDTSPDPNGSEPVGDRVRIFRRGRVWYANFQHGGKQHRESLKTSSKKEARRRALKIEGELENNRWKPAAKPTKGQTHIIGGDYLARAARPTGWKACNLRTAFGKLVKRAGLEPWPRLFRNQTA